MNLIHLGETFYLDYKNHLAYEKNYFVTDSVSKNGWGFFEIGVWTPNSNYTPDHAELFVTWSDKSEIPHAETIINAYTYNQDQEENIFEYQQEDVEDNNVYQYAEAFVYLTVMNNLR